MAYTRSGLAAAVLFAALTGCSGGGGGTTPPPTPPPAPQLASRVVSVSVPAMVSGDVPVRFTLVAAAPIRHDLRVEISRDSGQTWQSARVKSLTTGLAASPAGVVHTIEWDSLADVGFRNTPSVLLRLTPVSGSSTGIAGEGLSPPPDNRSAAARAVQTHMVQYGALDAQAIALAEQHDLVVVHPFAGNVTPAQIREIQDGVDAADPADDVIVLGYISVGEDLRTIGKTDAELLADPRFVGDGSGPRIDPRGPSADGQPLVNIPPTGIPSNGGTGFASWFLDDNSVDNDPNGIGDGSPDRNSIFGGCFANAGDPAWFDVLDQMTIDGPDGLPGMAELLTDSTGRGYGCDGLFLDTIDTCAPNSFTNSGSPNQSEFEWTAPGFAAFIERVHTTYPGRLVLQNRGLFFYDARHPHHRVNPRSAVDFVLFESFRLNSNTYQEFDPYFYADNRYNVAPKLLAEAARDDGFVVLSLGYAEGPAATMSTSTLLGQSTLGQASLLEDIRVTEEELGFRHYLTDAGLTLANTFVIDNAAGDDGRPPRWTSTYNDNAQPWPTQPGAPTPRVGIQQVISGPGCVTVRWDIAVDYDRVGYALYASDTPFDFGADPNLASASRTVLSPASASAYATSGQGYPNEAVVTGLTAGTTYFFCLRAFDARGNEEQNQVVLSAVPVGLTTISIDGAFADWTAVPDLHVDAADVPDSAGPDWLEVAVANDTQNLYIRFTSENAFQLDGSPAYGFSRTLMFIDADEDPATGYAVTSAVGSELLVAGGSLFGQASGQFNTGLLEPLPVAPLTNITECELSIPLQRIFDIAPGATSIRLLLLNDDVFDFAPDAASLQYRIVPP